MRVSFRQGIVRYQQPEFLTISGTNATLLASTTSLVVTIAYGSKDFLHVEQADVVNAWTGLVPGVDQWLYLDIDTRTGARTFGITSPTPIIGHIEPVDPAQDQHWFDTNLNLMKVWDVNLWFSKIRIIICRLDASLIPRSVGDNLTGFGGTQINNYTDVNSGLILFDGETNLPIKDSRGQFITSEDNLFTQSTAVAPLKIESTILQAVAGTNIPKYTIVRFSDYGIIRPANEYTSSSSDVFGIIRQDAPQGTLADITIRGIVTSNEWDWSAYPVNTPLYINTSGTLITTPVFFGQVPIATIIDPQSIMLGIPQMTLNTVSNPHMTDVDYGIGRLNIPAVNPADPIVVGDNDPRLSDDRYPLAHVHTIADVTALQPALDSKLNLTGGTITGPLIVPSPTLATHASTKDYVDTRRILNLADVTITSAVNNDILKFNGTHWVNTPIPSSNVALQGDVIGTGTTASPITTTLATVVVPGTATKVTYDAKGRITSSTSLIASDIPSLDWSKITTGKPTTLGGYGITDAYNTTEIDTHLWNWTAITSTPTTIAGYGITDAYTITEVDNHTWSWNSIISGKPTTLAGYGITNAIVNQSGTPGIYQDVSTNRPAGVTGQLFVDTTNNKIQRYSGTSWVDLAGYPITLTGDVTGSGITNITVTLNTVPISKGGTGATTANAALNSLLPSQAAQFGKVLTTDGTNASWTSFPTDVVTSVNGQTGTVNITTVTGNAGSATVLQTARNIAVSGDISGTTSFNGSSDATISTTLATVNATVGAFGSATQVGTFTVNGKGLITLAGNTTVTPAWSSITTTPTTLAGYGITDATPISHISDATVHLTSAQNTWIDAITASSAEVNQLVGVTGGVQSQLNSKLALTGGTLASGANITLVGGGEIIGLPSTPSVATAAASKAYVDNLVVSGTSWRNPVVDPDLIDVVTAIPGAPIIGTYLKYGGSQNETWGSVTNVVNFDIMTYSALGVWSRIDNLTTSERFIVAGRHGPIGPTLAAAGFVADDIIQYVAGDPTLFASWALPDGRGAGGAGTEIAQGITVLVNHQLSNHFGHTYMYEANTNSWVEIAGPGSIVAGTGLAYTGNTLNAKLGAGITELPSTEIGTDLHASGGLFTTVDGTTLSTITTSQLAIKLNGSTLSLSASGLALTSGIASVGTYKSVTVDTYGRVTAGTNPTTLSGYGITDAQPLDADLTAIAALTGTSGFLKSNGAGIWSIDTNTYITANQSITLSGDVTGTGTTAIAVTLNTVPISKGGTGQTTATAAFDALAPTQTGNTGKFLTTNGTTTSWATVSGGAGNPGGLDTQLQYNSAGSFAGAAGLTTDGTNLGIAGNITLSGASKRIFGDFSNATDASRVLFQTTATNGSSTVGVIPHGTNTTAALVVYNDSAATNASTLQLGISNTTATLSSTAIGTGTVLPIAFQINSTDAVRIDTNGNVVIGTAALTTTATDGFLYIPTTPGTPTGVPTAYAGRSALTVDTTGNALYGYDPVSAAWLNLTGAGGGGGTPGGVDTQLQYNSAGSFAGATGLTTDGTNLTIGGNLSFSGTSRRITGDFSNSTNDLRTSFQTSTTNGVTYVNAWPNGSGNSSAWFAYATSATNSAPYVALQATTTEAIINSAALSLGTAQPISFKINGTTHVQIPTGGFNAVNNLTLQGSQASNPVTIGSSGSDTNVPIKIDPKGTGNLRITAPDILHSNGDISGVNDAVTRQYILRNTTSDATTTELFTGFGSGRMTLSNNSTWKFQVNVVGRRTNAAGERIAITLDGCIDRAGTAASTTLVGSVMETIVAQDTLAWNVTADADTTNGSLRIQVTGVAASTIRWVAFVRTVEVTG